MATTNLLKNPKLLTAAASQPNLIRCYTPLNPDGQPFYDTEAYGNVIRPDGWFLWCVHAREARHDWDPDNREGWVVPEVKLTEINADGSRRHPSRWHGDARSLVFFNRDRTSIGGIGQRLKVTEGHTFSFGGWGEGWNAGDEWNGDPHCSWGAECEPFAMLWDAIRTHYDGQKADALESLRFRVGIDPTGGTDPLNERVVWGDAVAIYNAWDELPSVSVVAEGEFITAFVWAENRLRTHMNDRYVTDLWLVDNDAGSQEPAVCPRPREEWTTRTSVLVRFAAPHAAWMAACEYADRPDLQHDVCRSWDHLFWGPGLEHVIGKPWFDIPGAFDLDEIRAWGAEHYPTIDIELIPVGPHAPVDDEDPPPKPPVANTRRLLGCHGNGEGDIIRHVERFKAAGLVGPTCKSYGQPDAMRWLAKVKAVDSRIITVGRIGDHLNGVNIAGPDFSNPEAAAELAYRTLKPHWATHRAYVDYWETVNEQRPASTAHAILQARYYLRLMDLAEADGYKLALFGYSLGVPEPEHWDAIATTDVFPRAYDMGHALSLHEYGRFPKDGGHILGRFADLYDRLLLPDWPIPLLITEYNVDEKVAGEGLYGYTYDEWLLQMQRYDALLRRYNYVLGAHVFTYGTVGNAWEEFDPDKFKRPGGPSWADGLMDWQIESADDVLPPAPPGEPPEPPIAYPVTPFSQRDSLWSGIRLGNSNYTVGSSGCTMVSYASLLTLVDATMTPRKLVDWLNANSGFTSGGLLWMTKPFEMPGISGRMKYVRYHTWRNPGQLADLSVLRRLLDTGPTVIQVDFRPETDPLDSHFVLALRMIGDSDIEVMDPWTGRVVRMMQVYGQGRTLARAVFAAVEWAWEDQPTPPPPQPSIPPLIGFNDPENTGALRWMIDNGVQGLCVVPVAIGTRPAQLDFSFSAAAAAGIRVIVNLRYGWSTDCGGAGTLPGPWMSDYQPFIEAAISTMQWARGVWGWELFNEYNNPREHPKSGGLVAGDIVVAYNTIRRRVGAGFRMAPGALDPFNAQAGDPREWLRKIWIGIDGAEFTAAHGYVRGPDADLVGSMAQFQDAPLQWQYLNYPLCIEALLEDLPQQYWNLPVYVTEFNHLWKTTEAEGKLGWVKDGRAVNVVNRAYEAAEDIGYAGLALYRWAGDAWALKDNSFVLESVKAILS